MGAGSVLVYQCLHCSKDELPIWVRIVGTHFMRVEQRGPLNYAVHDQWVAMKLGQFPSWSIDVPAPVERSMGQESLDFYTGPHLHEPVLWNRGTRLFQTRH